MNCMEYLGGWLFENEIKVVFRDLMIIFLDVMYSGGYRFDLWYVIKKGIIYYKVWNYMMEIVNYFKFDYIIYIE